MVQLKRRKIFYSSAIRAILSVIALTITWALVIHLPMLQDLRIKAVSMSGTDIARISIALIIIIVLLRLAYTLETQLPVIEPRFSQGGLLTASIVHIVAIFIAYNSLLPLATTLLRQDDWVFQVVFLLLLSAFFSGLLGPCLLLYSPPEPTWAPTDVRLVSHIWTWGQPRRYMPLSPPFSIFQSTQSSKSP